MVETYGFNLADIVKQARENGNNEFADLVEVQVHNLQACYEAVAQKHSATGEEKLYDIDAEYLKSLLK